MEGPLCNRSYAQLITLSFSMGVIRQKDHRDLCFCVYHGSKSKAKPHITHLHMFKRETVGHTSIFAQIKRKKTIRAQITVKVQLMGVEIGDVYQSIKWLIAPLCWEKLLINRYRGFVTAGLSQWMLQGFCSCCVLSVVTFILQQKNKEDNTPCHPHRAPNTPPGQASIPSQDSNVSLSLQRSLYHQDIDAVNQERKSHVILWEGQQTVTFQSVIFWGDMGNNAFSCSFTTFLAGLAFSMLNNVMEYYIMLHSLCSICIKIFLHSTSNINKWYWVESAIDAMATSNISLHPSLLFTIVHQNNLSLK